MKVKVLETAFYDMGLVKPGEIIDFKGEKMPKWATLADGVQTKTTEKETVKKELEEKKSESDVDKNKKENITKNFLTDEEYLNLLINEGIEKGILIEDADKKTLEEQIKELEEKLKNVYTPKEEK